MDLSAVYWFSGVLHVVGLQELDLKDNPPEEVVSGLDGRASASNDQKYPKDLLRHPPF